MAYGFYCYRIPNGDSITFGTSENVTDGLACGFHIAPFLTDSRKSVTIPFGHRKTIPVSETRQSLLSIIDDATTRLTEEIKDNKVSYSQLTSTDRDTHRLAVEQIRKSLLNLEASQKLRGKVVCARMLRLDHPISAAQLFMTLEAAYPSAFIFMFGTAETGIWAGATPETLLKAQDNKLHTMSLAGTRPAGTAEPWDSKNIEEQRIVTDYISDTLTLAGLKPEIADRVTHRAGPVEHLMTAISAELPQAFDDNNLVSLLGQLSPTPALCGYPKEFAQQLIERTETFPRNYYGGYCGPIENCRDFQLYVNLRCVNLHNDYSLMYAGGGITIDSDPDAEWEETERKLSTLLRHT